MKKKFLMPIIIILFSTASYGSEKDAMEVNAKECGNEQVSEESVELSEDKAEIDWRVGPQVCGILGGTEYRGSHEFKMTPRTGYGLGFGAVARFVFNQHWVLHTSVDFSHTSSYLSTLPSIQALGYTTFDNVRKTTLTWPLMGGYRFPITDWADISFMGGVASGWCLSGKISNRRSGKTYEFFGDNGVWRRYNFQISFGYSIEMFDRFMISGVGYIGMLNLGKSDIYNYSWNGSTYFSLSLAYLFGRDYPKWQIRKGGF